MKTRHFISVLAASAFIPMLLQATASKDNVGTVIEDLKDLRFSGAKPDIEGKPYLLEFWATWCPPCRDSIPHLNELYATYKEKGMAFIGVTDEDRQIVRTFTKEIPIDYFIGYDVYDKVGKAFGIKGIPHAMIVDKSGKIVWEGHPASLKPADLDKVLAE